MKTSHTNLSRQIQRGLVAVALVLFAVSASAVVAGGVVNINTADQQTLELLPRVGPAVAERIVDYREQNGKFAHATDLMLVRGIGEKTFDQMEAYVAVEGQTTLTEKVRVPRPEASEPSSSVGSDSESADGGAGR